MYRGLFELNKIDLFNLQYLIVETIDRMYKLIVPNTDCLSVESENYAQNSKNALRLLWKIFDDNHIFLNETDVKIGTYFTGNVYKKNEKQYFLVQTALDHFMRAPIKEESCISPRDEFIRQQREKFNYLKSFIQNTNIDVLNTQLLMEECQNQLSIRWAPIEAGHKEIRHYITTAGSLPDVVYELDYVRYKIMYQTTYSLLNYKIDAITLLQHSVVPQVGIPTWRMFNMSSEVHAFSVISSAWDKMGYIQDLIHNSAIPISEADKRQMLIKTFLECQMPVNPPHNLQGLEVPDSTTSPVPGEPVVYVPFTDAN